MNRTRLRPFLVLTALVASLLPAVGPVVAASSHRHSVPGSPTRLVSGLDGGSGSTVGPDGALYVTERVAGRVSRVDPETGGITTFADGLPKMLPAIGVGGAMDVAFIGKTAYVLVTMVGPDLGGDDTVGIYRVDSPNTFTVVADIGAFSLANPPVPAFFIPTGVQYALNPFRGGFLVTDGHHNRVLQVALDGEITELIAFGDIVPTGLAVRGNTIYMAEAGPIRICPRTEGSCRSGRSRQLPRTLRPAEGSSSTSSSAAGRRSSHSHRASGRLATPRDRRHCQTPESS